MPLIMSSKKRSKRVRAKRSIVWIGGTGLPTRGAGRELESLGHPLHWEPVALATPDRVLELNPVVVVVEASSRSTIARKLLVTLEELRKTQEFFVFLLLDREPRKRTPHADAYIVKGRGMVTQFKGALRAVLATEAVRERARRRIKKLEEEARELRRLVVRDDLTCLFNLRFFNRTLENEHSRAMRFDREYSLVFIDLDGLKEVNNRFGHIAGGRVLKQVGDYIGEKLRKIDIPARIGGDEFVIICPETPKMSARLVAERIRQGIEELNRQKNGPPMEITVSMGVAAFPDDGDTPEQVLDHADRALFEAKAQGKNRVCCWGEFPSDRKPEYRGSVHGRRPEEDARLETEKIEIEK